MFAAKILHRIFFRNADDEVDNMWYGHVGMTSPWETRHCHNNTCQNVND